MKKEKTPPPKRADEKVKNLMQKTKAEADKQGTVLKKGSQTEPPPPDPVKEPVQQPQQTQQQTNFNCKVCVANGGKQVGEYRCTKCKKDTAKAAKSSTAAPSTEQPKTTQPGSGLPTGKVITEALNGIAVKSIADRFGKDYNESKFKPDQIDVINACYPDGEIPKSWGLGIGMTLVVGLGNIMSASKAEIDKDVETLKKEHKELKAMVEHLKTYAEKSKATIEAQNTELKKLRREPLLP